MEIVTVKVKISDMAILREEDFGNGGVGFLRGIALYDPKNKVGGLAHILLPDSSLFRNRINSLNSAKFADTAIPCWCMKW